MQQELDIIPAALDTQAFREAWAEWLQDRRERRIPMTPRARRMALKKMESWGPDTAVAAIEHSIIGGYKGIFQAPVSNQSNQGNSVSQPQIKVWEAEKRIKAMQARIEELLYPGGCAHPVELSPDRQKEVDSMRSAITKLNKIIRSNPFENSP
ncbi:MAG: hypothetical protein JJT75_14990 [Opitutales bacterium]|nr:hypothetical protein [Opitutales bacterium]